VNCVETADRIELVFGMEACLHCTIRGLGSARNKGNFLPRNLIQTVVVVISSLKMRKAFLICSGAQRNFAYTFVLTFSTDLPSQILKLISN